MSIKFRVLGGGGFWGGGECRFYFYGRGDFSENPLRKRFENHISLTRAGVLYS